MFRKGDKVLVPGIVKYNEEDGRVFVDIVPNQSFSPWLKSEELTLVAPTLTVGEVVLDKLLRDWEVLAIHGDLVWCGAGEGFDTKVYMAADLSRAKDVTPLDVPANT